MLRLVGIPAILPTAPPPLMRSAQRWAVTCAPGRRQQPGTPSASDLLAATHGSGAVQPVRYCRSTQHACAVALLVFVVCMPGRSVLGGISNGRGAWRDAATDPTNCVGVGGCRIADRGMHGESSGSAVTGSPTGSAAEPAAGVVKELSLIHI